MPMLKKPKGMVAGWMLGLALLMGQAGSTQAEPGQEAPAPGGEATRSLPASGPERVAAADRVLQAPWNKGGADVCLACHGEYSDDDLLGMFRTSHASPSDPRSPMAQHQCESCHGPGGEHGVLRLRRGEERPPMIDFGQDAWTPVETQNAMCQDCHRQHTRLQWEGSSHAFNEVSCASCHQVHTGHDPVQEERNQAQVCYECHQEQRAQFSRFSHHPVGEGQMACSDCHSAHDANGAGLTMKARVREACTECHAEKRGPFLWEHAPAAEDCSLCHEPHGSGQPALLTRRSPQLCQECHSQFGHPSVGLDGSFAAGSPFVTAKGCLNCHSQVHGSNHPSGVSLTR